jgi:protein OS-9
MTVTDTILFIKETTTCHYVLVIQTPRLCGDPAFRSRRDSQEQSTIRCREIVQSFEGLGGDDLPSEVEAQVPPHVWASEKEFRDQVSQPLPNEKGKKTGKAPAIDDALLAKIVNQLRNKGIGNFNQEKAIVLEDPDNGGTVFLVELEDDGSQGPVQGQQEQLEIEISEETMQALLDQARNQRSTATEGDEDEQQ